MKTHQIALSENQVKFDPIQRPDLQGGYETHRHSLLRHEALLNGSSEWTIFHIVTACCTPKTFR